MHDGATFWGQTNGATVAVRKHSRSLKIENQIGLKNNLEAHKTHVRDDFDVFVSEELSSNVQPPRSRIDMIIASRLAVIRVTTASLIGAHTVVPPTP